MYLWNLFIQFYVNLNHSDFLYNMLLNNKMTIHFSALVHCLIGEKEQVCKSMSWFKADDLTCLFPSH